MTDTPRLKITDVKIVPLKTVREVGEIEPAWNPGTNMRFTIGGRSFVEVHTDQGLVGIGPGIDPQLLPAVQTCWVGKDTLDSEGHAATVGYSSQGMRYRGTQGV